MRDDPEQTLPSPAPVGAADKTLFDGGPFAHGRAPSDSDMDATVDPATRKLPSPAPPPPSALPRTRMEEAKQLLAEFLQRHEKKLWWLHTAWALSLGAFVATVAQKGFDRARFLTISLGASWLLVVLFFRFFGTGSQQDFITAWPGARRRFFVMSYLMKNLFQGMLFFLLPLYYKSASTDAKTIGIVYLLGGCAVLSTLDLVFDRVLLRFKLVASLFFAITLFGSMNVALIALLPNMRVVIALLVSGALAIVTFFLFHVPLVQVRRPMVAATLAVMVVAGTVMFYVGRRAFPAVPLYVARGGVGLSLSAEGDLAVELKSLRTSAVGDLYAVTDVWAPGHGDALVHVWRKDGKPLAHVPVTGLSGKKEPGFIRLVSRLSTAAMSTAPAGRYSVDVETVSGQAVGQVGVEIRP